MNGSLCPNNGEIVVTEASSVLLNCSYDNPLGETEYTWYLDDVLQSAFNTHSADIAISVGAHVVKCRARISESTDCVCEGAQNVSVAAIGTLCVSRMRC